MLENVMIFGICFLVVSPFVLGWLFKNKMGMSWVKTISFAVCYPLSVFAFLLGIVGSIGLCETPALVMPILICWFVSIVSWGSILSLLLRRKQSTSERFNLLSYLFFVFPIMIGAISLAVFAVTIFLSLTGYINPEIVKLLA